MIKRIFGRYKNIFLALLSIFIIALGLRNAHSFYQSRITRKQKEIEEMAQAIKSAQAAKLKELELSRLVERFISPDSYKFISTIGNFAAKAGLEINSLRYVPARAAGGRKTEEGPVSRLALSLNAEGDFGSMLKFLKSIEDSGLTIIISGLKMTNKQNEENTILGNMDIIGLAYRDK